MRQKSAGAQSSARRISRHSSVTRIRRRSLRRSSVNSNLSERLSDNALLLGRRNSSSMVTSKRRSSRHSLVNSEALAAAKLLQNAEYISFDEDTAHNVQDAIEAGEAQKESIRRRRGSRSSFHQSRRRRRRSSALSKEQSSAKTIAAMLGMGSPLVESPAGSPAASPAHNIGRRSLKVRSHEQLPKSNMDTVQAETRMRARSADEAERSGEAEATAKQAATAKED